VCVKIYNKYINNSCIAEFERIIIFYVGFRPKKPPSQSRDAPGIKNARGLKQRYSPVDVPARSRRVTRESVIAGLHKEREKINEIKEERRSPACIGALWSGGRGELFPVC
jgi:hypothetical protein